MAVRVLIVEASSGGVVGGSLTGFLHLVRGLDRSRFAPAMALYEHKSIEPELAELGVPVYHIHRKRLPKEHGLLRVESYHRAKRVGAVRGALKGGRQAARLVAEELPAALQLARVARSMKADVLHLGNGVRANFDGILAGMITRIPVVVHVKGFEKYSARERWAARRIACLVSMTEAIARHCRDNGIVAADNRVVYDAVDLAWLAPKRDRAEVRRELGVGTEQPLLLISGNIQEWKGQAVVVEAMGKIASRHPAAVCVMAGGVHRAGEDYAARMQERIAELGLGQRIRLLGFQHEHTRNFLLLSRRRRGAAGRRPARRGIAEEERFSRKKHDAGFPKLAIQFCLEQAGISIEPTSTTSSSTRSRSSSSSAS
jgi:glycosyltransferase involved in cell wall biosynthesis